MQSTSTICYVVQRILHYSNTQTRDVLCVTGIYIIPVRVYTFDATPISDSAEEDSATEDAVGVPRGIGVIKNVLQS